MPQSGFTGISYPFRVNSRGGVSISTTSVNDPTHIKESIEQILKTSFLERPMEGSVIYSSVDSSLFEPNNETLQSVLRAQIIEDLERLEERIEVEDSGVTFEVEVEDDVEYLYVVITYTIIRYDTAYTSKIKVGEVQ